MSETEKSAGWWFAAYDYSEMWEGPYESRAQAIQVARDENPEWDQVFVCEAFKDDLRLADWIGLDSILEGAEDRIMDGDRINTELEEGPFFLVTPDQATDLQDHIRAAITAWQEKHGLVFTCQTFSDMRHMEDVKL